MATKQKRNNDYFLCRLEAERPEIAADLKAGRYPSVGQALVAAGLVSGRTPLHELRNAWGKATLVERSAFFEWARAKRPCRAALKIAVNRYLEPAAKTRIAEIMTRRRMLMGKVISELGFKPLDASLGLALRGGARLRPALVAALELWLKDNALV